MKRFALMALASGLAIAAAVPASAAVFIAYSTDGGATKTGITSGSGTFGASGTAGGFNYSVGATGAPDLASPDFSTNSINVATNGSAGGSIIFYFTQTGNTSFNGNLSSAFTSNVLSGSAQNVTVASSYSAADALYTGTALQSKNFSSIGTFTGGDALNVTGPFSTTVTYTLNFGAGSGRFNTTADLTAVPEPATWGMMVLGFGVVGSAMRRRTTKATVSFV